MISAPFSVYPAQAWTPIPSTSSFTIGSQESMGGVGIVSTDGFPTLVSLVGSSGSGGLSPVPVAQNLAGGVTGVAYSETISAQGGTSPYSFAVTAGALPAGLGLNSSTGVISGTPTTAGTSTFTVKVTDAAGATGSQAFQIVIAAPSGGGQSSFVWVG